MKVEQSRSARSRKLQRPSLHTLLRWLLIGAAVTPVLIACIILLRPDFVQHTTAKLERRWGYAFRNYDQALTDKWSILIGSYVRDASDDIADIPELVIDVPFKEMRKIYAKRNEALERGILVQGDDDFVKGEIRLADVTVPIKLRLKGDWNDHLMGRKWSFRIRVRGDDHLFGMRRFSIQNPNTRGFQTEMMYFEVLKHFNIMVPRYQFVNVTLNGESMGVMALEEFFAKEMLEYNQRREGVIVRFDESLAWDARDAISGQDNGWGGAFDHYSNALVDGIGSSRIAKSPVLSKQYAIAAGLLRSFSDGSLPASAVFDSRQLGTFIAVADYFGSWHSVAWHNMRFYLNPITLRLEPIPFDATLQDKLEDGLSVINDEPIVVQMMRDAKVWQVYVDVLAELSAKTADGTIPKLLTDLEAEQLPILQTEFRMLGNFPLAYLQPRVNSLLTRAKTVADPAVENPNLFVSFDNEHDEYPVFAHLGLLESTQGELQLQVDTAIPRDVVVTAIEWVNAGAKQRVTAVDKEMLPLNLPARGIGSVGQRRIVDLAPAPAPVAKLEDEVAAEAAELESWQLEISVGLARRDWVKAFHPQRAYAGLSSTPIPRSDAQAQLAQHSFLQLNTSKQRFEIAAGVWDVLTPLIVPPGYSLYLVPGVTLRFAADASLVAHGPVRFAGNAEQPIKLVALNEQRWPGMVVTEAGEKSLLRHVMVHDTTGVKLADWALTGGINFYASDVEIESCMFFDSHGEDALNIINSEFIINDMLINGTASDAFDADFAQGRVTNSRFANIGLAGGGDAVDVSGSQITVIDSKFDGVSDKAVSVGELSQLVATRVLITNVGTGAAAKDGSTLQITDSTIRGASFAGITAYIKKPEYGPAHIQADKVLIQDTVTPVLVQTGSRVLIDGVEVTTSNVNVDDLYDTVMRKGLQ